MLDGFILRIRFEITLSDIGFAIVLVHQNPIPGLVFRRSAPGNLLIPFFSPLKYGIDIDNHATIVKQLMVD